jgi:hypothetical protein
MWRTQYDNQSKSIMFRCMQLVAIKNDYLDLKRSSGYLEGSNFW